MAKNETNKQKTHKTIIVLPDSFVNNGKSDKSHSNSTTERDINIGRMDVKRVCVSAICTLEFLEINKMISIFYLEIWRQKANI